MSRHRNEGYSFWEGIVKAMGLVFGDIGTSPIYTLTVIMALIKPTESNVFGILSLIVWTLILLVTIEYAWLAMSLEQDGQGGTVVLKEILVKLLKSNRQIAFVGFLSFLGISLILGDGVITPAITILSAVEGMRLVPGLAGMHQWMIILIAALIAISLFFFQYKGTDKVAGAFGPLMVIWFITLAVSGIISIQSLPGVIKAVNPLYALSFLMHNGIAGGLILSEVILCATGGEALYADMGHLGKRPIIRAWYFVFLALVINYLGQGAFILRHPEAQNILFGMFREELNILYIPTLILTILATVIASQSLISGVYSIVYQGITTRIMPWLRISYTSSKLKSQIYLGSVNWSLMVAVVFIMLVFRRSENLAAAYGLAVTGTMTITGIMMTMIFSRSSSWKAPVAAMVTVVDAVFLIANLNKLSHGGYWSLILAAIPLATILIWTSGQKALYHAMCPMDMKSFIRRYEKLYEKGKRLEGAALFFNRTVDIVHPYLVHCILDSGIIYDRNILVSVRRTDEPYGLTTEIYRNRASGMDLLEFWAGYREVLDIESLLKQNDIEERVIFYGVEDITTNNFFWTVFAMLKRLAPTFVQFYKLPAGKIQGVVTRVEM
ncbi:MAG: KUP/HAK/KT family potassium transporter [bacterium]|jgi:KUP system potassium uptake protein|nr:KUP/HAK/KT family potassium transporter [bacterium]MDD4557881.1 KUP/HAK/KT family potassium transporter [bacterium]